jgi:hypothetical protein
MEDLMAHEPISFASGEGMTSVACKCGQVFQAKWGYYKEPAVQQREHRVTELNRVLADLTARIEHDSANEMLRMVVGSLQDYPNHGGDIRVMKEVDRIEREARQKTWEDASCELCRVFGWPINDDKNRTTAAPRDDERKD